MTRKKRHPGYIIGNHWLETAYDRICAGEPESEVLADYGWRQCAVAQGTTQFCALAEEPVKAEREACLSILLQMERRKWAVIALGGELSGCSLHDAYAAIRARSEK